MEIADTIAAIVKSVPGSPVRADKGDLLFSVGFQCPGFLWIDKGEVRVQITTQNGREILLYRLRAGEPCLLTTSCLLGAATYYGEGIVESRLEGSLIPASEFNHLIASSEPFRTYILGVFGERLSTLFSRIEGLGAHRIDHRLAAVLLQSADETGCLAVTHEQLARELGSVREVISRKLKIWQTAGLLTAGRGQLTLQDKSFFENLSSELQNQS